MVPMWRREWYITVSNPTCKQRLLSKDSVTRITARTVVVKTVDTSEVPHVIQVTDPIFQESHKALITMQLRSSILRGYNKRLEETVDLPSFVLYYGSDLCSPGPIFPGSYVPRVLCSPDPMLGPWGGGGGVEHIVNMI